MHILGDGADAVPRLLLHGGQGASCRPPTRIPTLLKGLQDTMLNPLELQPVLPFNGAPLLQRAPVRRRVRRLGGCGFGRWRRLCGSGSNCDGRHLGDVLLNHRASWEYWARFFLFCVFGWHAVHLLGSSFGRSVHSRASSRCISALNFRCLSVSVPLRVVVEVFR